MAPLDEKRAVVFPGQGCQKPGMGKDFAEAFPESLRVYEEASEAVGLDMARLCFGDDERLHLTEFTQPAILTTEIAMLEAARSASGLRTDYFGGHSLGEYTGLVAAGVVPLGVAVTVVRTRGRLMQEAVPAGEGAMAALIGRNLDIDAIATTCQGLNVDIANLNSPGQIVLSGASDDMNTARGRLADAYGKAVRAIPLRVSAPFHSRLMRAIEPEFRKTLEGVASELNSDAATRVTSNFSGAFHEADTSTLIGNLTSQISNPVRWVDNMKTLDAACSSIVEIGPGRPLRAFFDALGISISAISDAASAKAYSAG